MDISWNYNYRNVESKKEPKGEGDRLKDEGRGRRRGRKILHPLPSPMFCKTKMAARDGYGAKARRKTLAHQ